MNTALCEAAYHHYARLEESERVQYWAHVGHARRWRHLDTAHAVHFRHKLQRLRKFVLLLGGAP